MSGSLAEYYHWEETNKGIRLYMHAGMADRLQAQILVSANEVGGILLGRTGEENGKATAFIDDFVPVPCSHRAGPLYSLADEDTLKLEAALLRVALAGCESSEAPSILGYYRSHLREGLSLSAADLQIIDSYFQEPASVFLLVKVSASTKSCTAGFFFWEDGMVQPEFSSLEVALGRKPPTQPPLGPPPGETHAPAPLGDFVDHDLPADLTGLFRLPAMPQPPAESIAVSVPPPPGKTPHVWAGFLLRAATILIATVALVVSVVTYLGAPRPPREEAAGATAAPSMLGLQVERTPPDLLVTWNRNAREIVTGQRATLSIRDGKVSHLLNLDKSDLKRGSSLYTPSGDDLQFRLEVYGADHGSVAQSILLPPNGSGAPVNPR